MRAGPRHERSLLAWALKQQPDRSRSLPRTLRPEYYAIAMVPNEPLRRQIKAASAHAWDDQCWSQFRSVYLGNQTERH